MAAPDPLDLHHLGDERVIGAYLLETADGLALQDCGPSTCIPALKERLAERGLALTDLRHLLLSHIHLDHAGAAGVLVREHPGLQVHVSEIGAPHIVDPSRLEGSYVRVAPCRPPQWGTRPLHARVNGRATAGVPAVGLRAHSMTRVRTAFPRGTNRDCRAANAECAYVRCSTRARRAAVATAGEPLSR